MKAPDKLYVAESRKIIGDIDHNVFSEQPFLRGSIEYIRKDALLEWLEQVKADPMIPMNIDKVIKHIKSL